jgi:hypothetical protein
MWYTRLSKLRRERGLMRRLFGCLSPKLYPPTAVVFFLAFLLLWGLRVAARFTDWSGGLAAGADLFSYVCLAAAAVINGRTARFRSGQRQWVGRAPGPAVLGYACGAGLLMGRSLYLSFSNRSIAQAALYSSDSPQLSLMLGGGFVLLAFGAYWHGFVLHLFTPARGELLPSPTPAPPVLRALAWLGPLPLALSHYLMAAGVETRLTRELGLLIGAALFASAYFVDAVIGNRVRPAPADSGDAVGRSKANSELHLTRRGWAGALFWLALLLHALAWYLMQLSPRTQPGSDLALGLLVAPLAIAGLAGLVLLSIPPPVAPSLNPSNQVPR